MLAILGGFLIFSSTILAVQAWASCPGTASDCYASCGTNCYNAIDGKQATLQAIIDSLANNDTVSTINVPAGTVTWASRTSTASACAHAALCINNRNVHLIAAANYNTIIQDNTDDAASYSVSTIHIAPTSRANVRISGFYFKNHTSQTTNSKVIRIWAQYQGTTKLYGFRIDNNKFEYTAPTNSANKRTPIAIDGYIYGLIDNNTIMSRGVHQQNFVVVDESNLTGTELDIFNTGILPSNGTLSWNRGASLGSPDAVYVEDNTMTIADGGTPASFIEAGAGSRIVARYNTLTDTYIGGHGPGNTANRGVLQLEAYGNQLTGVNAIANTQIEYLGGTGLSFYNSFTNTTNRTYFTHYRTNGCTNCAGNSPNPYRLACTGNGSDGTGAVDVGNAAVYGYPCSDQVGRSGALLSQTLLPVYTFVNGGSSTIHANYGSHPLSQISDHIQANRDYYDYTASFNGTSGVGCGTLANRPATCSTGVGYWATNQSCSNLTGMVGANPSTPISGTLYKCTAANTWTAYYKPYTYPHPLRGGLQPPLPTIVKNYDHDSSWALDTAKVYTYSIATTQEFVGNQISKVSQDGATLTAATSKALVESAKGSYYFDSSTGKLYLHCTNDVNPASYLITVFLKKAN
jgi:hypothetical protein